MPDGGFMYNWRSFVPGVVSPRRMPFAPHLGMCIPTWRARNILGENCGLFLVSVGYHTHDDCHPLSISVLPAVRFSISVVLISGRAEHLQNQELLQITIASVICFSLRFSCPRNVALNFMSPSVGYDPHLQYLTRLRHISLSQSSTTEFAIYILELRWLHVRLRAPPIDTCRCPVFVVRCWWSFIPCPYSMLFERKNSDVSPRQDYRGSEALQTIL